MADHFRTLFKARLQKEHPDLCTQVPEQVWGESWNVGCQAAGCGLNALRYLSRYLFKTATSNRTVPLLPEGKLLWTYRQSKTRQFTSLKLEPLEFMSRFLHPPACKPTGWKAYPPAGLRARAHFWLVASGRQNPRQSRARPAPSTSAAYPARTTNLEPILTGAATAQFNPSAGSSASSTTLSGLPQADALDQSLVGRTSASNAAAQSPPMKPALRPVDFSIRTSRLVHRHSLPAHWIFGFRDRSPRYVFLSPCSGHWRRDPKWRTKPGWVAGFFDLSLGRSQNFPQGG